MVKIAKEQYRIEKNEVFLQDMAILVPQCFSAQLMQCIFWINTTTRGQGRVFHKSPDAKSYFLSNALHLLNGHFLQQKKSS